MGRISKRLLSKHQEALQILEKEELTYDDKIFVFENFHEGASGGNSFAGAFFTPIDFAPTFAMEAYSNGRIVDMCAGIGALTWGIYRQKKIANREINITCIEFNPEYVRIGKKLMPEVNWIEGDITDASLWESIVPFDMAISNPPYGKIKTGVNTVDLQYTGSEFELKALEIATKISDHATFLIPQMSTPFKYSGDQPDQDGYYAKPGRSKKYDKFSEQTGIELQFNMGISTDQIQWKQVSIVTELVNWENEAA